MAEIEIKKSVLSFPVFFEKSENYTVKDDRFTKVKIYLMHTGLNYNESIFDKEIIDAAIPSLQYIPITGFIEDKLLEGKDFTEHKYIIVKDDNGIHRKYIGYAYGVILSNSDNNAHYEMRVCDDGIEREFLVVDGVIWNMFEDSCEIINRDFIKNHSMELEESSVEGYEDENGYFHFTKFSFRAACILGDDIEPAMVNSTIEVNFAMNDFIKSFQNKLIEKYTTFTKIMNTKKEGGTKIMPNVKNKPRTDYSQTVMQQFEDISTIVSQHEFMKDRWGDAISRYYAVDIQDNEVIVVDRKNNYQYYGLPFSVNGDSPEINFINANRKKICYENYEEGSFTPEGAFDFGKHISEIENVAFEKVSDAESKIADAESKVNIAETNYANIKKDYEDIEHKYNEYVKAELKQKEKELNAQKDAMFEKFEKELGENTDFVSLKENKENMSIDEIETKCSLLYTRSCMERKSSNSGRTEFSKYNYATVGITDNESGDDEGITYVSTKYGNIPVRH